MVLLRVGGEENRSAGTTNSTQMEARRLQLPPHVTVLPQGSHQPLLTPLGSPERLRHLPGGPTAGLESPSVPPPLTGLPPKALARVTSGGTAGSRAPSQLPLKPSTDSPPPPQGAIPDGGHILTPLRFSCSMYGRHSHSAQPARPHRQGKAEHSVERSSTVSVHPIPALSRGHPGSQLLAGGRGMPVFVLLPARSHAPHPPCWFSSPGHTRP